MLINLKFNDAAIQDIVQTLTEPNARLQEPGQRDQARILSILILLLFVVVSLLLIPIFLVPAFPLSADESPAFEDYSAYAAFVVLCTATYLTVRRGYPRSGALALVVGLSLLITSVSYPNRYIDEVLLLNYLIIPVILCVSFLPTPLVLLVMGLTLVETMVIALLVGPPLLLELLQSVAVLQVIVYAILMLSLRVQQHLAGLQQQRATEREALLSLISANMADSIIMVNRRLEIQYSSPSTRRLFGYAMESSLGRSILDVELFDDLHPDDQTAVMTMLQQFLDLAPNEPEVIEYRYRHADGAYLWLETNITAVKTSSGALSALVFATRDITERKLAQEQQAALQAEKELRQVRDQFMRAVSHEFRSPLASMQSSVDMLERYSERLTASSRLERLTTIRSEIRHMTQLVDDMLLIMRIESAGFVVQAEQILLPNLFNEIVREQVQAQRGGDSSNVQLDIPTAMIGADQRLLRYIVGNLVGNALKYSPENAQVTVSTDLNGKFMIITVQDQGRGIPVEDQEHIFEAFYRGSNVRGIEGTGLGLRIVRDCVTQYGGELRFESKPNVGTTFTVQLPLLTAS